ncbi:MAG: peptidoglycan DD-metalloendopeptidase family protein [Deltaproteobacteria bacterium]|nr:peptidoglycan DD-metalloendopeptidase family protein [Deltaproteobacteria bacterium]
MSRIEGIAAFNRPAPLQKDTPAEIKKALTDFESLFINEMLKTMRETVVKSGLFHGGSGEEIYSSLFDEELSKVMASGEGIGLRTMLMKEFGRAYTAAPSMEDPPARSVEAPPSMNPPPEAKPVVPEASKEDGGTLKFPLPIGAKRISSGFGLRNDPFTGKEKFHHGIDIAAKEGSPVYPAQTGKVVFSGNRGGYGNVVEVSHGNGLVTRYGHNLKNTVKEGDIVDPSTPIAYVGSTGRSTGPHLHFEALQDGVGIDPATFRYG